MKAPALEAFFAMAPMFIMPLLDESARLDMVDFYEAAMPAKATNRYGGMSEMTSLSDTLITLKLSEASTMELRLLADSTVEVRHTVETKEQPFTTTRRYDLNYNEIK